MSSTFTFNPIINGGGWCDYCNCPNLCGEVLQVIKDGSEAQGYAELVYGILKANGWDAKIYVENVQGTDFYKVGWACNRESALETPGCKDEVYALPQCLHSIACCTKDQYVGDFSGNDGIFIATTYNLPPSLNGIQPAYPSVCEGQKICKCDPAF